MSDRDSHPSGTSNMMEAPGEKAKVTIVLKILNNPVATVELSALEFDAIRSQPLVDAVRHVIQKVPLLREEPRLCAELLHRLRSQSYRVRKEE